MHVGEEEKVEYRTPISVPKRETPVQVPATPVEIPVAVPVAEPVLVPAGVGA